VTCGQTTNTSWWGWAQVVSVWRRCGVARWVSYQGVTQDTWHGPREYSAQILSGCRASDFFILIRAASHWQHRAPELQIAAMFMGYGTWRTWRTCKCGFRNLTEKSRRYFVGNDPM
jgi:hypothetical protein